MSKPAAEKPRGAAAPVTPIQKGSFTMRKRNFNINVRVTEGEKKRLITVLSTHAASSISSGL